MSNKQYFSLYTAMANCVVSTQRLGTFVRIAFMDGVPIGDTQ
ncbi:MAG: hypothetical protein WD000_03025 [Thermodesulfobacteriota bacterium]